MICIVMANPDDPFPMAFERKWGKMYFAKAWSKAHDIVDRDLHEAWEWEHIEAAMESLGWKPVPISAVIESNW
jgi:hypothetical protein